MFGPDKCGATNKVHFIFRHMNPVSKAWEEKHYKAAPVIGEGKVTHLYTAHILPNNTIEIYIDKVRQSVGDLLVDFSPTVNPPKQIDDPTDKKPKDWVDEESIPDPDATKPDDWDESAPKTIVDIDASKPNDWDEDEPEQIPDPEAKKPDDWNEEEDGEFVAPLIDNPKCTTTGCGQWKPPQIPNPKYKGKWSAPKIPNPAYKGKWKAKQIDNPNYFEDLHPHNFAPIAGIGIEIWTMTSKITYDNIFIGESLEDAFNYADATWKIKYDIEKSAEEKAKQSKDNPPILDAILKFIKDNIILIGIVSFVLVALTLVLCTFLGKEEPRKKKTVSLKEPKKEDEEEEEKDDEETTESSTTESSKTENKTTIRKRKVQKDKKTKKYSTTKTKKKKKKNTIKKKKIQKKKKTKKTGTNETFKVSTEPEKNIRY